MPITTIAFSDVKGSYGFKLCIEGVSKLWSPID